MARVFNNLIDDSPNFKIDVIVGGFYIGDKNIIVWTQERSVMRIDGLGAAASLTISVTAGVGLADEITTNIEVSFASSQVQYVDITDVLRSVFDRSKKLAITDTSTAGRLVFEFFDGHGSPLGKPYVAEIIYYDALTQAVQNDSCVPVSDRWLLPDTFRIPAKHTCSKVKLQASTRMTRGADELKVCRIDGTIIDMVGDGETQMTYGWAFVPSDHPAIVELKGPMGMLESARVVEEPCNRNTIVLTWWSPVIGGWKSVVAEVVGDSDDVSDSERYIIGWDYGEAKGGMLGLRVRIPNCTPRDYEYYRDIYYSSFVQVYDEALWSHKERIEAIEKEVMVIGNPPQPKLNGYVDLEMTLKTAEVSSIW